MWVITSITHFSLKIMCTNPRNIIVNGEEITVKCGKCITCRKQRAAEWAIKLINESKYHKEKCFVTLTFDNEKLLDKNSKAYKYGANPTFIRDIKNSKNYFTKFMKRLRKKLSPKRITYYKIGEYGEIGKRPHYHVLIFGTNFNEDRKEAELSKTGKPQYFSQLLEDTWACGRTRLQDVNPNNVAYITQYSLKKLKQIENNKDKYKAIQSFSNRSKMGVRWVRRYPKEIEKGYLTDDENKKYRIPKSYKENLKNEEIEKYKYSYLKYEQKSLEKITNTKEQLEKEIVKEKIDKIKRIQNPRDF